MADYNEVMNKLDYLNDTKTQIRDAIIEKGQDITELNTFRDYVTKILNIDDSNIKIYANEIEMYEDTNVNENDVALVFNKTLIDINLGSSFINVTIPREITLRQSVIENNYYLDADGYKYNNSMYVSVEGKSSGNIAELNIELKNSKQTINLYYESTDLDQKVFEFINGTIVDENGTNIFDFDTEDFTFEFDVYVRWNFGSDTIFNYVFKGENIYFGGLYVYKINHIQYDTIYYGKNPGINVETYNTTINYTNWLNMENITEKVLNLASSDEFYGITTINSVSDLDIGQKLNVFSVYKDIDKILQYNNKLYIYANIFMNENDIDEFITNNNIIKMNFDLANSNFSKEILTCFKLVISINNINYYYAIVDEITANTEITFWNYTYKITSNAYQIGISNPMLLNDVNVNYLDIKQAYLDKYVSIPLSKISHTITPEEYAEIIKIVNDVLGGPDVKSKEREYIDLCNKLAIEIIGE